MAKPKTKMPPKVWVILDRRGYPMGLTANHSGYPKGYVHQYAPAQPPKKCVWREVFGSHENCRCDIPAIRQRKRLIARIRQIEAEVEDWRNREASACPEDFGFEEVIAALRAAAQERDRQIEVLEQERDDDTALIRRLNATVAAQAEEIATWKESVAGKYPTNSMCQDAHPRVLFLDSGEWADDCPVCAARRAALKPESKE